VVIDWVDGKNVSAHRGKSITLSGISPNEAMPKLIPVDENTLKVLWSNGASLDLKEDGTPKSSNFLPDGFFSPAACRTGSEKSHFSPEIKVLNSQSFTKDIDPLIK
jgi:hypothetical protein